MVLKNKLSYLFQGTDKVKGFVDKWVLTRWLFERSNLVFFYGIFLFLYEIAFLRHLIPVFHPFLISWALLIFAYDLIVRKIWSGIPKKTVLGLFVISAALTAVFNLETGLVTNVKAFIMTLIPIFTFYPLCVSENENHKKKIFIKSTLGASIVCFFTSVIALGMLSMNISRQIVFNDDPMTLGYRYYIHNDTSSGILLYGINEDTNHSAAYALVFVVISLITFINCKNGIFQKKWVNNTLKTYSIANIVVQICYFPLANSRGAWLALLISLFFIPLIYFYFTRLYNLSKKFRIIKSIALTLAAVVIISVGIVGIRTILSGITNKIVSVSESIPSDDVNLPHQEQTNPEKTPSSSNTPVINSFDKRMGGSRLYIWQDTISLIKKRPVLGNGPGNNQYFARKYSVAATSLAVGKHVHNSYLDLLLNYGVVGFLIMMVFLVRCVKDILSKVFFDGKNRDISYYLVAFSALIVVITSFFLSSVFINTTAVSFILFIALGYLVSEKQVESIKVNSEA